MKDEINWKEVKKIVPGAIIAVVGIFGFVYAFCTLMALITFIR